jgi:hypothetical protein
VQACVLLNPETTGTALDQPEVGECRAMVIGGISGKAAEHDVCQAS